MIEVASVDNILDLIQQTSEVGKELYSHILEFLSSESVFIFPKQLPTESMTSIASAIAAGLTEDEKNLLLGKRLNSAFENDPDFEAGPSNPPKKKSKKSRQAGGATLKKSTLSLVDGVFSINGIAQETKIDEETSDILAHITWSEVDLQNSATHCYPILGNSNPNPQQNPFGANTFGGNPFGQQQQAGNQQQQNPFFN